MHRVIGAAAITIMLATPALAQKITTQRTSNSPIISTTARALPANVQAADVAAMAAASSESYFVMRASQLALSKGSPQNRELAAYLIGYHTQALSDFRGAALAANLRAPVARLSADHQRRLTALEAANGAAFDSLYRSEVSAAHERASSGLLAHGKSAGNLIIVAQANRQGNQIAGLKSRLN